MICVFIYFHSNDPHAWVMTIDEKCEVVFFWEIGNNMEYELRNHRISDPTGLAKYLTTCTSFTLFMTSLDTSPLIKEKTIGAGESSNEPGGPTNNPLDNSNTKNERKTFFDKKHEREEQETRKTQGTAFLEKLQKVPHQPLLTLSSTTKSKRCSR